MWHTLWGRLRGRYRGLDRAALDAQYSPSRCVDDIDVYLTRYAQQSAAARDVARRDGRVHEDQAYGAHPDEAMDLFLPAGTAPAPVLIYVHGGYWQMLSRKDSAFAAPAITNAGGAWVAVGYTLAPQATLAQIVGQIRRAIAWVYAHAERFGLDRQRICVAGSSAGAHLAVMALLTSWREFDLPDDVIKGVCAVSGIYDLTPIRLSYVNEPLGLTPADVTALSPLGQPLAAAAPVLLAHGDNETDEFKRQSRVYASWLRRHDHDVQLVEIAGRNHFDVILDLNDPTSLLGGRALDMLGLHGAGG